MRTKCEPFYYFTFGSRNYERSRVRSQYILARENFRVKSPGVNIIKVKSEYVRIHKL